MFTLRKSWKGGVAYFGWKPPLSNPRYFTSQRSTPCHSELHHTGDPQLPQLFCPRMVELLVGIFSLRRIRGRTPVACTTALTCYHYATQPTQHKSHPRHVLSILWDSCQRIGTETCKLDNVFPPHGYGFSFRYWTRFVLFYAVNFKYLNYGGRGDIWWPAFPGTSYPVLRQY